MSYGAKSGHGYGNSRKSGRRTPPYYSVVKNGKIIAQTDLISVAKHQADIHDANYTATSRLRTK